jgi:hypothetical protein
VLFIHDPSAIRLFRMRHIRKRASIYLLVEVHDHRLVLQRHTSTGVTCVVAQTSDSERSAFHQAVGLPMRSRSSLIAVSRQAQNRAMTILDDIE